MKRKFLFVVVILTTTLSYAQQNNEHLVLQYFGISEDYEELLYLHSFMPEIASKTIEEQNATIDELHKKYVNDPYSIMMDYRTNELVNFRNTVKANKKSSLFSTLGTIALGVTNAVAQGIKAGKEQDNINAEKRAQEETRAQEELARINQNEELLLAQQHAASNQYITTQNYGTTNAKVVIKQNSGGQQFANMNDYYVKKPQHQIELSSDKTKMQQQILQEQYSTTRSNPTTSYNYVQSQRSIGSNYGNVKQSSSSYNRNYSNSENSLPNGEETTGILVRGNSSQNVRLMVKGNIIQGIYTGEISNNSLGSGWNVTNLSGYATDYRVDGDFANVYNSKASSNSYPNYTIYFNDKTRPMQQSRSTMGQNYTQVIGTMVQNGKSESVRLAVQGEKVVGIFTGGYETSSLGKGWSLLPMNTTVSSTNYISDKEFANSYRHKIYLNGANGGVIYF